MITRRERIQNILGKDFIPDKVNAGLWFDKFIEDATSDKDGGRMDFVKEVVKIEEPSIYKSYFENIWQTSLQNSDADCRCAKVKNRLAINLGAESILETSIALHRLFGVPFIPGSALKGLVSHFLHHYGGNDWKIGSDNHTVVFGNQDNAGFVTFYDALYIPGSGYNKKALYADVMTTHHQDYYSEKKENNKMLPPADWDSPNPIAFISATGEYLIALSGPKDWVEITFDILGFALAAEGIGAKTSSGYGRLKLQEKLQDETLNYTDKYEIILNAQSDSENSDSDISQPSAIEIATRSLISRINAMNNNEVAGRIGNFVNDWRNLEDETAKKQVATAIKQKVIDAGREKASSEKEWFKQISLFAE